MAKKQTEHIPFHVELSRIIEVLAKEIYQSPLALLRENTQNAFDAILLRRHLGQRFAPRIEITIAPESVQIVDNGIGMTRDDLKQHFWRAGASSKNTTEAREAGVVGTFGIGAMANFGIAEALEVETESALTHERTFTAAERATLSTTQETIEVSALPGTGKPGTSVTARLAPDESVDVGSAEDYLEEFVAFVDVPVAINGRLVSQQDMTEALPSPTQRTKNIGRVELAAELEASVIVGVAPTTGEIWLRCDEMLLHGQPVPGVVILKQGVSSLRTFRSGFGLATAGVSSHYQFGGLADMRVLEPTAGREALTTASLQILQSLVGGADHLASEQIAMRREADLNTSFMHWVVSHGRYDLCGKLTARVEPASERGRVTLSDLAEASHKRPVRVYAGGDQSLIGVFASDDSPLVVLAGQQPRRQCEDGYLAKYAEIESVTDAPRIIRRKPRKSWSVEEQALVFRVTSILETDYFLQANVELAFLSHELPVLAQEANGEVRLALDPTAPTFGVIRELYKSDFGAFGSMAKDFVRNFVFPRVADYVPSSTRQGAEAFLKTIGRTHDVFEYERGDLGTLTSVWQDYLDGKIPLSEAANRATVIVQRNVQEFDRAATATVRTVVPDVVDNETTLDVRDSMTLEPTPPIMRTDTRSEAKLLLIDSADPAVKGYRGFIALSDRAREERGEFFLQPHSTSIVWGGQKVLFIFEHHSGRFGLYYDLQASESVSAESGGGPFPTATIVLGNRIYIPVPDALLGAFVPEGQEKKRFEVRSDLLFTEDEAGDSDLGPPTTFG
jgi:molecular chaperone HtpG